MSARDPAHSPASSQDSMSQRAQLWYSEMTRSQSGEGGAFQSRHSSQPKTSPHLNPRASGGSDAMRADAEVAQVFRGSLDPEDPSAPPPSFPAQGSPLSQNRSDRSRSNVTVSSEGSDVVPLGAHDRSSAVATRTSTADMEVRIVEADSMSPHQHQAEMPSTRPQYQGVARAPQTSSGMPTHSDHMRFSSDEVLYVSASYDSNAGAHRHPVAAPSQPGGGGPTHAARSPPPAATSPVTSPPQFHGEAADLGGSGDDIAYASKRFDDMTYRIRNEYMSVFLEVRRSIQTAAKQTISALETKYTTEIADLKNELRSNSERTRVAEDKAQYTTKIANRTLSCLVRVRQFCLTRRESRRVFFVFFRDGCRESRARSLKKAKANRAYQQLLKRRAYKAWRQQNSMLGRLLQDKKVAEETQRQVAKVAREYEQRIEMLNKELERQQEAARHEGFLRKKLEEDLKKAYMRGICALNIEAMSILNPTHHAHNGSRPMQADNMNPHAPLTYSIGGGGGDAGGKGLWGLPRGGGGARGGGQGGQGGGAAGHLQGSHKIT
eukprot:Rmarinus@m.16477